MDTNTNTNNIKHKVINNIPFAPDSMNIHINLDQDIILTRKMYYNDIVKRDTGFYPQLNINNNNINGNISSIFISFKLYKPDSKLYGWKQVDECVIYGFTRQNGVELLQSLNIEAGVNASVITNSGARIIYPATYNSTFYILDNYSVIRDPSKAIYNTIQNSNNTNTNIKGEYVNIQH